MQCRSKSLLFVVTHKKPLTPPDPNTVSFMNALEAAFDLPYLDPDNYVARTAAEIASNMHEYTVHRSKYNSPYTSFVISSMMGKSRHLKEVAAKMPTIYLCFRPSRDTGFRYPSPVILQLIQKVAISTLPEDERKNFKDQYFLFCTSRLSVLSYSIIHLLQEWINKDQIFNVIDIPVGERKKFQYSWSLRFFAEPSNKEELSKFWTEVTEKADGILLDLKHGLALDYLKPFCFARALAKRKEELAARGLKDYSTRWLFVYDEARMLCDIDALDGTPIMDALDPFRSPPLETVVPLRLAYPNLPPSLSNWKCTRHQSNLENILQQFPYMTGSIKTIEPYIRPPWWISELNINVRPFKIEAKDHHDKIQESISSPTVTIYTDGSGITNKIGAAFYNSSTNEAAPRKRHSKTL